MRTVEFKNECSLHLPANSMLVIANAGFNIEQAVIYKTCENVNHSIHLIPPVMEWDLAPIILLLTYAVDTTRTTQSKKPTYPKSVSTAVY